MRLTCICILFLSLSELQAQDYIPNRSNISITAGTLGYSGRYSVKTGFFTHNSYNVSMSYDHTVIMPMQLYVRGNLVFGELKGDNTAESSSSGVQGYFKTNILEGSLKAEYEILNRMRNRLQPFVFAGAGAYRLFNYVSDAGLKSQKDKLGFIMPVGGGLKYSITERTRLICEGNVRLFSKNLDNNTGATTNNPNRYYSINLGVSYSLQKLNRLW